MRALIAIIIGLVVGLAVTIAIGIAGGLLYPPSGTASLTDPEQVIEVFARSPLGLRIALMLGWFGGALAGAACAKLIARKAWAAWAVTGLIAAYVVINIFALPMPGWMQALSFVAPLLGGLIGNHLVGGAAADAAAHDAAAADG